MKHLCVAASVVRGFAFAVASLLALHPAEAQQLGGGSGVQIGTTAGTAPDAAAVYTQLAALGPPTDISQYGARCDYRPVTYVVPATSNKTATLAAPDPMAAVGETIFGGGGITAYTTVTSINGSASTGTLGAAAGAVIGLSAATTAPTVIAVTASQSGNQLTVTAVASGSGALADGQTLVFANTSGTPVAETITQTNTDNTGETGTGGTGTYTVSASDTVASQTVNAYTAVSEAMDDTAAINATIDSGATNVVSNVAKASCFIGGTVDASETQSLSLSAPSQGSGMSWICANSGGVCVNFVGANYFTWSGAITTLNSRLPAIGLFGSYISTAAYVGGNNVFINNPYIFGKFTYSNLVINEMDSVHFGGNGHFENTLTNTINHAFVFDGEDEQNLVKYDTRLTNMPVGHLWNNGVIEALDDDQSTGIEFQDRGLPGSSIMFLNGIADVHLTHSYFVATYPASATTQIYAIELWNSVDHAGVTYSGDYISANFERFPYMGATIYLDGPLANPTLTDFTLITPTNTDSSGGAVIQASSTQTSVTFSGKSVISLIENGCDYNGDTNCVNGTPWPIFDRPAIYSFGGDFSMTQAGDLPGFNLLSGGGTFTGGSLTLGTSTVVLDPPPTAVSNTSTSTPVAITPIVTNCKSGYDLTPSSGATIGLTISATLPAGCPIPITNLGAGTVSIAAGSGETVGTSAVASVAKGQTVLVTQHNGDIYTATVQ